MLREELIEPLCAPDEIPADLAATTPFDEDSIRAGLPPAERFRVRDLRRPAPLGVVVVAGIGTAVIRREPRDILEFVLDVDRYSQADFKVGKVRAFQRTGNSGEVRHDGRFLGIRAPAVTLAFRLTPSSRLDFLGVAMPWPIRGFDGYFTCEPSAVGTKVVHREAFSFGPILGRILGPLVSAWLSRDTPAEVVRMKRILESEVGAATSS
jgi:hypothetical protein